MFSNLSWHICHEKCSKIDTATKNMLGIDLLYFIKKVKQYSAKVTLRKVF